MVRGHTPLPETIGRFRIQEVLGRGGMGEVYKAFDPTLQRTVAVKTIRPDIDRPDYLERMMHEAQACARLSHPNIVTIFEAAQADGVVYVAMEFLQGQNLAEALEKSVLSFEDKILILTKVLTALQHAHALDVVHRDIKPSNIHLCADGTIKLMDFGLARVLTAEALTGSGNVLGTPHYASPEQLKGEAVDRRTDIYSTGVMAYEMLSGRRPFEPDNATISSVIIKVISEAPKPMDTDLSRMLPEIETIVSKAMAKSPNDRYQSADDMCRALTSFLNPSRARLTAIDAAAGATVMLRSTAPLTFGTETTRIETAPAAPAGRNWWFAGSAAVAAAVAVVMLGRPGAEAENASVPGGVVGPIAEAPTPAPVSAPPATLTAAPPASAAARTSKPLTPTKTTNGNLPVAGAVTIGAPTKPVGATAVARGLGAKELFNDTDGLAVAPGLRFRMMLERPDGTAVDVDPARDFHSGERIKFAFESNIDGYLYVAQQGTSGNWTVLFPNPDINGGLNAVKSFEEYEVPQGGWFMMDSNSGVEQLFVFLSREPIMTLPGFDRPVRTFESGSPALVTSLQQSIQSRDLIFAKDTGAAKGRQATYVVNKSEVGKAVTAKFTITHKP